MSTQQNVITRNYGSYCQEEYQSNWQGLNSGGWTTCANFNSSMSQIANQSFYWNLHGVQSRFEESGDAIAGAGADTVDVLWLYTHGGAWSGQAVYAMWDQNSLASSSSMRLGDDSRGLSLWVFHGCETLRNDADLSARWSSPLSGGLRIAVVSVLAKIEGRVIEIIEGVDQANRGMLECGAAQSIQKGIASSSWRRSRSTAS